MSGLGRDPDRLDGADLHAAMAEDAERELGDAGLLAFQGEVLLAVASQVRDHPEHAAVYFRCAHVTSYVMTSTAKWLRARDADRTPEMAAAPTELLVRALIYDDHVRGGLLERGDDDGEPTEALIL